jgi:hypothetical protein
MRRDEHHVRVNGCNALRGIRILMKPTLPVRSRDDRATIRPPAASSSVTVVTTGRPHKNQAAVRAVPT